MKNNKLLLIVAHLNIYNNSTNVTAHINRTHAVRRIKYIYLVVLSQLSLTDNLCVTIVEPVRFLILLDE